MPGGSSSGSAVAVGAGLVDFSLGEVLLVITTSCMNVWLFLALFSSDLR